MEIKRNATAHWEGSGKDGKGTVSTASTVLDGTQYSFNTRFADGVGTNPEELAAAAHAGCFAMQLAFNIQGAGFTATFIDAKAVVSLDTASSSISSSKLTVKASVPGLEKEKFDELVEHAEKNCPISKLFNTAISVDATLE
ncbi:MULTISPECIES: OsmC family peroxiredoxin [Larkinella]|jgi:osmotically inducible protein OsmC|uniref:OsmC family peroxiredoxin n=1 Tax=Larkinella humicola TaxID=2607654 RepID=A0A5N1JK07_9BACT|nr:MULTISPECIES: OsmC family peroxiredoxin [Larkinella]KAA9356790.1 OsmC family peroxiredoxin [Larkinella humicola]